MRYRIVNIVVEILLVPQPCLAEVQLHKLPQLQPVTRPARIAIELAQDEQYLKGLG